MRRSRMLPPAVRWLCLLCLIVQGVTGQLSVGEPDSFLLEDLEAGDVTPQPEDTVVVEEPQLAAATEVPPDDSTLADLEDAVTYGETITPETITALEEEEIISVANADGFGAKIDSDVNSETSEASAVPELTRRILVSGTIPTTPVVPEPSVSFSRPSSLGRFVSDPGWIPNFPSHLLPSDDVTQKPTLRFPTEPPPSGLVPTPVPFDVVPAATPLPSIIPSLTVSKVPITEYVFDLTSAASSPPPGPLYNPDELVGSITPGSQDDLNRPVVDLASSIPELQSSAFMQTADPVSVTPTLPGPQTLSVTESPTGEPNRVAGTPEATPTLSVVPTRIPPSIETEVVDNDLANEDYSNVTTLVSEIPKDLDPETSGPQPTQDLPDYLDGNDDDGSLTTSAVVDTSTPLSPTDPNAVLSEDPSGTGVAQRDSSATLPSPSMSESELASSPSTDSLGSIKSTSVTTLQAANTSRTPLWMLLSHSMPSQPVHTEPLRTTLTSPVVSIPVTESLTTAVPTVVFTDVTSNVPGDDSPDIDLVSSLLISSKLTSSNSEATTTFTGSLDTRTSLEDVSSLISVPSVFSTGISSTESFTDSPVSVSPTSGHIDLTSDPDFIPTTSPLDDPSSDDTIQPLDFPSPTTPIVIEMDENSKSTPAPPPNTDDILSLIPKESSINSPLNSTVEYHEDNPLQDPLSVATESTPAAVPTKIDSDTWTPSIEAMEKSEDIAQLTPSSTLTTDTPSVTFLTPELTGGFIPIISETTKSSPVLRSELMPENANISITSTATAIVASTSAPAESFSTLTDSSSSLTDPSNVQNSSLLSDRILSSGHVHTDVHPVSNVLSSDGLMSSNLLLSTTTFPTAKSEPTSVSLTPSFNVSVLSSQTPFTVNLVESETMTKNLEPSMVVFERLPSSSPILTTETLPSATPSTSLFSISSIEDMNVSSSSSVASVIPTPTVTPTLPLDPISPVLQPHPSLASFSPTSDLPSLVTPTVTGETTEIATLISHPEEPLPGEEEGVQKEPSTKAAEEVTEEGGGEEVVPEEPFSHTITPPVTTTTTTQSTTVTEKDMTSKITVPSTPVTSPAPTTPEGTVTVTFTYPSESMPSLTTSMTFPNGTVVDYPLPYVRALVAYSEKEFCQHRNNFRTMLAEWISQHLQEDRSVLPSEIEFFNMPQCGLPKPLPEEHINHFTENLGGMEEKVNSSLDNEEVTNVYFYVTRFGKINPNLTEMFPLFPMELEISEELTYLRAKVSQLELVRPDGSTYSAPPEEAFIGTSIIVIIVIVTVVGLTIITALIFFMVVKRRGATNNYYGRRCTPVSMDAYSMDSVSVYHSFRRKSKRRASGRSVKSYLNQAFDDPNGPSRPLNFAKLTHFISDIDGVYEEFATIPVNMPKYDELPAGVEDKNRYANVIPVPETRVLLKGQKDSPNSEYINANYVRGPRNESKYYIATQAPLDDTVADFWRMTWEQETRVVVMLTDFVEKGIDKCADYLPPSETLDCHRLYGDFQVTLKSRDMREKFVVSNVQLKNLENNLVREVAHMWFTGWPASGVPNEETAFISYILDIRRTRKKLRAKGPILVHCSPGTGRSGTFLACDLVMRQFEDQRTVDIPRTVYSIRRDRAGAVQTKEQYAFIYRVINLYASKLTTGNLDSL